MTSGAPPTALPPAARPSSSPLPSRSDNEGEGQGERARREESAGHVEHIHAAVDAAAPVYPLAEARLLPGLGIDGDRYARRQGTFSDWPRDHELTLIEAETLEAVAAEFGLRLAPGETRRNLTTRGVRLSRLVGRRFRIGGALCEGTRPCEPCAHLERVTGYGGLARMLAGRGGLRARILEGGLVRVGDAVTAVEEDG